MWGSAEMTSPACDMKVKIQFKDVLFYSVSSIIILIWIGVCLGFAISRGICCADDSIFACVSESVADGKGYQTPWNRHDKADRGFPFNPIITTGPPVIYPVALAIMLFGNSDIVPSVATVVVWSSVLGFCFLLICRRYNSFKCLLFSGTMVFLFAAGFGWHLTHFYTMLGEVPSALLIFLSVCYYSEKTDVSRVGGAFVAGLIFGLAVSTKLIAVTGCVGLAVQLWFKVREVRPDARRGVLIKQAVCLSAGVLIPSLLFEIYKFVSLGYGRFVANWNLFLLDLMTFGVDNPESRLIQLGLDQRIDLIRVRYGILLPGLVLLIAFVAGGAFFIAKRKFRTVPLGLLSSGLCMSDFAAASAWLFGMTSWLLSRAGWRISTRSNSLWASVRRPGFAKCGSWLRAGRAVRTARWLLQMPCGSS